MNDLEIISVVSCVKEVGQVGQTHHIRVHGFHVDDLVGRTYAWQPWLLVGRIFWFQLGSYCTTMVGSTD